jgi:hypothetical protein
VSTRNSNPARAVGDARGRRIVAFVSAIGLAAAVGPMWASQPAAAEPTSVSSGSTLVSGVVTRDGVVLGNADVIAKVWPNDEFLDRLTDGMSVPVKVIATGTTDDTGNFSLSVDSATLGEDYVSTSDSADIELSVADDSSQVEWNFTADLPKPQDGTSLAWSNPRAEETTSKAKSSGLVAPTHLLVDLGKQPQVVEAGREPANWIGPKSKPIGKAGAVKAASVSSRKRTFPSLRTRQGKAVAFAPSCPPVATNDYDTGRREYFVNAYAVAAVPVTVIQKIGTDHTLGIAVDMPGGGINFKGGGTLTKSFSAASEKKYSFPAKRVFNKVNYRKYREGCGAAVKTEWRPQGHHSLGAGADQTDFPNWSTPANCTGYSSGTYIKAQGSNAIFDTGVDLSVLNVSAQAKFSNETQLKWTFTESGKLCGSTNRGWVSSPQAASVKF